MERDEFEKLAQEYLQGDAKPEARERLAAYLEKNPDALREFVDQQQLHQSLKSLLAGEQHAAETVRAVRKQIQYEQESARFSRAVVTRLNDGNSQRRRLFMIGAAAACVLLAFGVWQVFKSGPETVIGTVVQSGDGVRLTRGNTKLTLGSGTTIQNGDRIATPINVNVTFELADHTRVSLEADSQLAVNDSSAGPRLALDNGGVRLSVTKQQASKTLAVVTPHATAEVLGTQFIVTVNGPSTTLTVTEGRVRFTRASDGKKIEVAAGEFAVTTDDAFASRASGEDAVKPSGRKLLFVVGNTNLNSGDQSVMTHLKRRGDEVRAINLRALTRDEIENSKLILISSTVRLEAEPLTKDLRLLLKYTLASIITWEPRQFAELGLTEKDQHGRDWGTVPDGQELVITAPEHPVAGGLNETAEVTMQPSQLAFGRVSDKATVIAAHKKDPQKAAVFVFARGVSLAEGSTARGARAGVFLFDEAGPRLSSAGWTIFDRLCDWSWQQATAKAE